MGDFAIPPPVLGKALLLGLLILGPVAGAAALAGPDAALGMIMGVLGTIVPAMRVRAVYASLIAVPVALTGAVALGVAGQPYSAAAFAALSCLLIAQGNMVVNGLLAGVPTIAAVFTCMPGRDAPMMSAWMLAGGLLAVLVVHRFRNPQTPLVGVPGQVAWLHASVMAVLVGASVLLVLQFQLPHGYWIPMTMTIVLRPVRAETLTRSRQRVVGTLMGAVVAVALVLLVPPAVSLPAAAAMMILMLAYQLLGRYSQQVMCMTPFVVLVGAKGVQADALELALQRVLETLLAVVIAGLAAMALARYQDSQGASGPTALH